MTLACSSDVKAENWVVIGFSLFRCACLPSVQDSDMAFVSPVPCCASVQLLSSCSFSIYFCSSRCSLWFTRGTWVSGITLKVWKPFRCFHVFLQSLYYLYYTHFSVFFSTAHISSLSSYPQQALKFSFVLSHLHPFFYLITFLKQWPF